jgi:hypothetical protein
VHRASRVQLLGQPEGTFLLERLFAHVADAFDQLASKLLVEVLIGNTKSLLLQNQRLF